MPCCRNCGARLSKLDKDICPVCGTKNPLDGVTSETIDITTQIDLSNSQEFSYKPCRKTTAFLLSFIIGWLGAQFFYLRRPKLGGIWCASNIVFATILFLILFFASHIGVGLSIALPLIIVYVVNLGVGIYLLVKANQRDGRGELVK